MMQRAIPILFVLGCSSLILALFGKESVEPQCTIGNFSLPSSQQPLPLISLGQNILDQGQSQIILFGDAYIGQDQHYIDAIPRYLYGITNDLSVLFTVPFAVSYRQNANRSSGIEDVSIQFEYAPFTKISLCTNQQLTFVAGVAFPSGSTHKQPATGYGAVSYFVGLTYNYTWAKWWVFTSYGAGLPTAHHGTRYGDQYLYQFGFGRYISHKKEWMWSWLFEIDGTYYKRDKIHGEINPDSGGNEIYLTPSLTLASKLWVFQLGAGYAALQNLYGNQKRDEYLFALSITRTL